MAHEVNPLQKISAAEDAMIPAIVERAREKLAPRPSRKPLALLAAAVVVAVCAFVFLRQRSPNVLSFEVEARRGVVKEWVLAKHEIPLRFSDGTTVLLAPDTRGAVAEVTSDGARVAVARGAAVVSVVPKPTAKWIFDVGPFALVANGTRFEASWEPSRELFVLSVQDGSVRVSGPRIEGERTYVAGQQLRIALAIDGELVQDETPVPPPPPPSAAPTSVPSAAPPRAPAPRSPDASWRELAADGRYAEALSAALPTFDATCGSASATDVVALADTARLGGDAARARKAYRAVRTRFPGTPSAALAAFSLGRMASQEGSDSEAALHFETYLREAPGDRLAREALGRAMESRDRTGDKAAARAHADEYVAKYPDGPHAKLARKIRSE